MVIIASSSNNEVVRGTALEQLLKAATSVLEKLISKIRSLPVVKKNGNSECPFAKEWYMKKEEYQRKLSGYITTLQKTYEIVSVEFATSQLNLERIGINTSKLTIEGPRKKLTNAQHELWKVYHQAGKDKTAIRDFLDRAIPILGQSQTIMFPDGKPQKPSRAPCIGPYLPNNSRAPIIDKLPKQELDSEIKDYIDMPPTRKSRPK
jgi:hypothetical protein